MKTLNKLALTFVATILAGNARGQMPNKGLEEAKKAIAEANAVHFKLYAKNDGSVTQLFADDACIFAPNGPALCGREGIAKFYKDAYELSPVRSGKITTIAVYGDGINFVTEESRFQVFDANGKIVDEGKSLVLWKKTKDGWKDFRDSFSSDRK